MLARVVTDSSRSARDLPGRAARWGSGRGIDESSATMGTCWRWQYCLPALPHHEEHGLRVAPASVRLGRLRHGGLVVGCPPGPCRRSPPESLCGDFAGPGGSSPSPGYRYRLSAWPECAEACARPPLLQRAESTGAVLVHPLRLARQHLRRGDQVHRVRDLPGLAGCCPIRTRISPALGTVVLDSFAASFCALNRG